MLFKNIFIFEFRTPLLLGFFSRVIVGKLLRNIISSILCKIIALLFKSTNPSVRLPNPSLFRSVFLRFAVLNTICVLTMLIKEVP